MLEKFSEQMKKIISSSIEKSKQRNISKVGTEFFIEALFLVKDSILHFLFQEYDIKVEEIHEITDAMIIIRKDDAKFTKKFHEIIENAKIIATKYESKVVNDEHFFLAILQTNNSIAKSIILKLGLSIEELIFDVKDIYNLDIDEEEEDLQCTKNITKMAVNNDLPPFVGRKNYIKRMLVILNRKTKNNPLLIGSAGVGKTALVEGLARYYLEHKEEYEIISLELSNVLAGTKYRGDFEEKLLNIINKISNNKKYILFIDEIHNLIGTGSSEGAMDAANMLKPLLARSNFKCIGATTIEEYKKFIEHDKALSRRFQSIFITEPDDFEVKEILQGIVKNYEEFHQITIDLEILDYIIETTKTKLSNRKFPDKAIDVLDEVMTKAKMDKIEQITFLHVDETINDMLGKKVQMNHPYYFPEIEKYVIKNYFDTQIITTLLNINYQGNKDGEELLLKDLKQGFGIKEEMILDMDFTSYQEPHAISSLIGSPPGYVGYENGGLLSETINKYPLSIVLIRSFESAHFDIQKLILSILQKGHFYDKKANKINCNNTIFIFNNLKNYHQNGLGFSNTYIKDEEVYDYINETIIYKEKSKEYIYNDLYIKKLSQKGYFINIDFPITKKVIPLMDNVLVKLYNNYQKGSYLLNIVESKDLIEIIPN